MPYMPRYEDDQLVTILDARGHVADLGHVISHYDFDHWSVTPTLTRSHIVPADRVRATSADDILRWASDVDPLPPF